MSSISEYIRGELDIFFFAPEKGDVARAVNELYGEDVFTEEEQEGNENVTSTSGMTCDGVLPPDAVPPSDAVPPTPERSSTASSVGTESPLSSSVPRKWSVKDLNFDMAGFSPSDAAAIQRKIESQRVLTALVNDLKKEVDVDDDKTVLTRSSTSSNLSLDPLNFLFGGVNQNEQATLKRNMKLQLLVDTLAKEANSNE